MGEVSTNRGRIINNLGDVPDNQGAISSNAGRIKTNSGIIETTTGNSFIQTNTGSIMTNQGHIEKNEGTVEYNIGTIDSNSGIVEENGSRGVIEENTGSVDHNYGTITQKDAGHVKFNFAAVTGGTVENNYGTVTGGTVEHNLGTAIDCQVTNEYYRMDFTSAEPMYDLKLSETLRADPQGDCYWIRQGDSSIRIEPALPLEEQNQVLTVEITGDLDRYEAGEDYTWNLFGVKGDIAISVTKNYAAASMPQTGDNSHMALWIVLLFISGGTAITLTVADRKRKSAANR